ncbi:hypothetical protein PCASD_07057 [Puccinia coronata f. sp. avenae]|uniref:Uncharacterized protein n=1 Tax=Puccinia coronata f. sp. avenae TaxID=200324 RepID=A0A2N5V6U5_9BASI|nr:hypothetical protein PCASD_07057 [Puccinia coronata f. sp. avenae]
MIATQKASIVQGQAEREARALRMSRIAEAILLLSMKTEPTPPPSNPACNPTGCVDLQNFRTSDGPIYIGPFHSIEPFLNWIKAAEIFFMANGVFHDTDRIAIVGGLICKTNTVGSISWGTFKELLFGFAPPPLWRTTLKLKLRELCMSDLESFLAFRTCGRTLQSMYNFDTPLPFSEWDLAKAVSLGLLPKLKVLVDNFGKLIKVPFNYNQFEQRSSTQANGQFSAKEDIVWRIFSYLDLVGQCHFCKKTCGHAAGTCPGPLNQSYIYIPASFVTPPEPADYKAPKAHSVAPSATAGQSNQPPAGRPANRATLVAALTKAELFPELETALVAALTALDKELQIVEEERSSAIQCLHKCAFGIVTQTDHHNVDKENSNRLIVQLLAEDCGSLWGLIDTDSEINLLSEQKQCRLGPPMTPLAKPIPISLALQGGAQTPISLCHATTLLLTNPHSGLHFKDILLKLGDLAGSYDMVLGTPFLSHFSLSISVSLQLLLCDKSENQILRDYQDLFPKDIPEVSNDAKAAGLFTNGLFPEQLQNKSSGIRHKIVLMDPSVVFNEKQYSYPQKHLVAWRTLIDQHVNAKRLRRSHSQYTSTSLIIPKKDPTALPCWHQGRFHGTRRQFNQEKPS